MAATFATQPEPAGPRVAVVTTAGGWGVITADAIAGTSLELTVAARRPDRRPRRRAAAPLEPQQPDRPGRRRDPDTITTVLEITARHPDVDGVILLGMGIQSNQARLEREGPLLPGPRPRAHRRLPRPPGPPLHRHRRGAGRRAGQAGAGGHRAGGDLPRQRRGPGRGRGRQALLPVVQPGRGRPGAPVGAGSMAAPPPPVSPGAPLADRSSLTLDRMARRTFAAVIALALVALMAPGAAATTTTRPPAARDPRAHPVPRWPRRCCRPRRLPTLLAAHAADAQLLARAGAHRGPGHPHQLPGGPRRRAHHRRRQGHACR